jgi:hypothetical protein
VKELAPRRHIDISSTLSFSAMLSAFLPVDFYDYRPAPLKLPGLRCSSANLLGLPFEDSSVESISCMHTLEHVGLGRYGDQLDPIGDKKAAAELARVTAFEGNLLIVVPTGKPRLCFNAHRVYSYEHVIEMFPGMSLRQFALIPDDYVESGILYDEEARNIAGQQDWGCGCFWFTKSKSHE